MTRHASTTNQTEAALPAIRIFIAVALDFTSGVVRAHDGAGTLTFGGYDYEGVGKFGGIKVAEESIEIIARSVVLSLSGVDTSLLTTMRTENYQGRSATIYLGFLNTTTNAIIDTPETLWEGRMDQMSATFDHNSASIQLSCEPRLRREPRIARYTDQDQQLAYSGDRFFDLIGKIPGFRGSWGTKGVANDGTSIGVTAPVGAHPAWTPEWRTPYRP